MVYSLKIIYKNMTAAGMTVVLYNLQSTVRKANQQLVIRLLRFRLSHTHPHRTCAELTRSGSPVGGSTDRDVSK